MTVYLILFWILGMITLLMELPLTRRARLALFTASYIALLIFVGLRWETGNDWSRYYIYYQHADSLQYDPYIYEVGYRVFSLATKSAGLPFAGFTFVFAAVYLGLIFLSFKHDSYEISGWLVLQLYAPFILGLMGTTRQAMAVAICMFSVRYLLSRQLLKFLLCVGLATLFHVSALVFLTTWPLARLRLTLRRVWIGFVVLVLASAFHSGDWLVKVAEDRVAVLRLADLGSKIQAEQESTAEEFHPVAGTAASLILETVARMGVLALIVVGFSLYREETDRLYFKFYFLSIAIIVLLGGSVFVLAERVGIYFTIFQMHLLAVPTRRIRTPALRTLYCAGLIVLSLTRLYTGVYVRAPRIFVPYKGVFINQDVQRDPGWF